MIKEIHRKVKENERFYPCKECKILFFGTVAELCKKCEIKESKDNDKDFKD